jgi:membrane-associated protein
MTGEQTKRFRWRTRDYSPEEIAAAKKAWRDAMPWEHPMSRGDKVLVFATLGVILAMLATMPLRPFLLASHPTVLAAVTGSLTATGAGAAFARVGEGSLWLVVAAGVFGMVKFDWLFWLAGRRWGEKVITLWAPGDTAQRFVGRVRSAPRWVTALAVVAASLPGVPAPAVFALAGLGRIRLVPFLVLDAIGAAIMTGLVAGLGYGVGQHAVDVVLLVDKYALWITLSLIAVVTVKAARRSRREQRAQQEQRAVSG